MLKKILLLLLVVTRFSAHAQAPTADDIYNQYLDFNLARFQGEQEKALELGEKIIPYADKLPEKARINFYASAGKMYEDNDQPDKAIRFYEKVAAAAPNYYVVHRALGYIYLAKAKKIGEELNNSLSDKIMAAQLTAAYTSAAKKALPHLEKAQACDPSDETLASIQRLYRNLKDVQGLTTLDSRLKQLGRNCIDLLSDH
jgi:tetratricopeptide (TPR) repeat protein